MSFTGLNYFKSSCSHYISSVAFTSLLLLDDAERDLEPLHRGVISDPDLENAYVVLSQHQMQNLGKTMCIYNYYLLVHSRLIRLVSIKYRNDYVNLYH